MEPLSPQISLKRKKSSSSELNKLIEALQQKISRVKRSSSLNNIEHKQPLKLPSIDKRSTRNTALSKNNSESRSKLGNHLFKSKILTEERAQLGTQISESSSLSPRKLELDAESSRHLEYLNRFEKAIIFSRMSNGEQANISKKKGR